MKKILVFGYVPKDMGGKQTSGLATAIFHQHNSENKALENYRIVLAATDIHKDTNIENTQVIGWNNKRLLIHVVTRPITSIFTTLQVFKLYLRLGKLISLPKTIAKAIFLDYAIKKVQPHIIHFHGSSGALLYTCLKRKIKRKKIKTILRIHGINGFNPSIAFHQLHRKAEQYITSLQFDFVTFVTKSVMKEWKSAYGEFKNKMASIHNGYDPKLFWPPEFIKQKKFDLITVSAISENKGQMRVLEALSILKKEGQKLSYLIVGDGTNKQREDIVEFAALKGLDVTIVDYIPQKEIVDYIHQCKYFILPSNSEGFGQVLIESIAAGVPVIIPKHLPIANERGILNSTNSLLIENSSVHCIAELLRSLKENTTRVSSSEISATVDHLKWDLLVQQHKHVYESI